jgi:hypothetical protein
VEASEAEEESFLDRRIIPVLTESSLLPIWIVVARDLIAFVVPMLLLGLRDRRFSSHAALVPRLTMSGGAIPERGDLGIVRVLVCRGASMKVGESALPGTVGHDEEVPSLTIGAGRSLERDLEALLEHLRRNCALEVVSFAR